MQLGAGVVPSAPTWSAHRLLSVEVEGPAATSTSGPLPGAQPSALTWPPPVRGGVRGSGVEIMLITEQDKFPGMTRGLAKSGGRQSRGDSWVGVFTYPWNHLFAVVLAFKTFFLINRGYVDCSRGHAHSPV